jgi:glc operon protein GlcG
MPYAIRQLTKHVGRVTNWMKAKSPPGKTNIKNTRPMPNRSSKLLLTLLSLIAMSALQAQAQTSTPPTQPSAGGLPARTPFDIPYGMPISLQSARQALQAAEAEAARHGWPEAIAVTDPNGELIAFAKMDDTQNASTSIAVRKAGTAARFRRDTRIFYNNYEGGHTAAGTLDPSLVASPGGFPLVEGGKIVGAIGCSGGSGDQDADICKAGVDTIK